MRSLWTTRQQARQGVILLGAMVIGLGIVGGALLGPSAPVARLPSANATAGRPEPSTTPVTPELEPAPLATKEPEPKESPKESQPKETPHKEPVSNDSVPKESVPKETSPGSTGAPWEIAANAGSVKVGDRSIFLTIDDGPSEWTAKMLEVLRAEEVKATWFWIVNPRNAYLTLGPTLIKDGHVVGTHTATHPDLTKLPPAQQRVEICDSASLLRERIGAPVRYFRPPSGRTNESVKQTALSCGLIPVLWSVDSRDWELAKDPDQIIKNVLARVKPGAIILIHERPQTLQILPQLICELRAQGYTFRALP
jgi:peptidoglycan/xylan/chitin deacetylase (PgdA/CDA1 family)